MACPVVGECVGRGSRTVRGVSWLIEVGFDRVRSEKSDTVRSGLDEG